MKITYSTRSNTTLVLGGTVSPPYLIKLNTVYALARPCMDDVSTLINPCSCLTNDNTMKGLYREWSANAEARRRRSIMFRPCGGLPMCRTRTCISFVFCSSCELQNRYPSSNISFLKCIWTVSTRRMIGLTDTVSILGINSPCLLQCYGIAIQ